MTYIPVVLTVIVVLALTLLILSNKILKKNQKFQIISFLMVFGSFIGVVSHLSAGVTVSEIEVRKRQVEEIEASCALIKVEDREGLFGSSKAIYQCGNTQISRKIGSAKRAELIKKITSTDKN